MLIVGAFKCCGKRAGILSGHRFQDKEQHWFIRSIVMLSAAFTVAAGSMYLIKATSSLYSTFDSIRDGANVSLITMFLYCKTHQSLNLIFHSQNSYYL